MGLPPDHYKHGWFLCLSCPPRSAQREGLAPGKYPEVCPSVPFPRRSHRQLGAGPGAVGRGGLGVYGRGSGLAAPSSRLPPAHPVWILSASLSWV